MMRRLRFFFILILLCVAASPQFFAKGKKKKKTRAIKTSFEVFTFYDNNILRYSDYYIDKFLSGENGGRFHVNTFDDLIIAPQATIAYGKRFFRGSYSEISFGAKYNKFFVNSIKDWGKYAFALRHVFPTRTTFSFEYSFIPKYYIRHYRDKEWVEAYGYGEDAFKEYSFRKDDFSFVLKQRVMKVLELKLYYDYGKYYYNKYFTEYDATRNLVGARMFYDFSRKLKVNFGVKYSFSDARGKKNVDPTYDEYKFYFGFTFVPPKIYGFGNSVTALAIYGTRNYLSPFSPANDPVHSGRNDEYFQMFFNYKFSITKRSDLIFYANYNKRDSGTSWSETNDFVAREKSFDQFKIGVKYQYEIKF